MKMGDSLHLNSKLIPKLLNKEDNKKINSSFFPFYNSYNKKYKYLFDQILGFNEKKYSSSYINKDKMEKVLAFKENIFVHNKNLTLNKSYKKNTINSQRKKYLIINKTSKARPSSANIKFESNIKNVFTKSKLILDNDYFDISYIKKAKSNIYNFKKNANKLNKKIANHKKSKSLNITHNLMDQFDDTKSEIKNKIKNLKFIKKNKPKYFMKRPISLLKEKYLFCLPSNLKKDTRNKYNFFSFILTDNIFNININPIRNKTKNHTNNNIFNNYIIKSNIGKNSKIFNLKIKENNLKNKIYKPVPIKINDKFNMNKIIRNLKEEEGYFNQKIKSHPFRVKN